MDPEELYEFKKQELNMFIPYVGKHIEAWKDIKDEKDAVIIKLSGLSNITCMIKANDKHVEPRSVIFRVFDNPLCESDVEDLVFQCMSDHGIGPKCYYKCDHYRIEECYDSRPITIFEMRNPVFLKKIIEIAFNINYNKDIKEKFIEIKGGEHQTQIDVLYDKWLPQLFDKFDHLYKLITVKEYIEIMDNMKEKWLTEDIYEYINALRFRLHLDKNDLVVSHNDIQELNVLSLKTCATKLVVIDYEYTTLGNKEYDLANIFCELSLDNGAPYFPFIEFYPENILEEEEFRYYSKFYLSLYYKNIYKGPHTEEEFINTHIEGFLENLYCSMVLDNFYWSFWSILMINEEKINDQIFNFYYFSKRMQLNELILSKPYIKSCIDNKIMLYEELKTL